MLRFWCLNRPDGFKRLISFRNTWEYKLMREREKQLVHEAYLQNSGGSFMYSPKSRTGIISTIKRRKPWGTYHPDPLFGDNTRIHR